MVVPRMLYLRIYVYNRFRAWNNARFGVDVSIINFEIDACGMGYLNVEKIKQDPWGKEKWNEWEVIINMLAKNVV